MLWLSGGPLSIGVHTCDGVAASQTALGRAIRTDGLTPPVRPPRGTFRGLVCLEKHRNCRVTAREHRLERCEHWKRLSMLEGKGRATFIAVVVMCFSMLSLPETKSEAFAREGAAQKSPPQSRNDGKAPEGASQSDAPREAADLTSEATAAPKEASTFEADLLEAARAHDLPHDFFKRLIWQESRFKPYAVSPAGAQGIAQFMPGTAQWRGLADPFNPAEALHESARWLRELWRQFGNLGLAAAAYNAGPGRVSRWLAGRTGLPEETRSYVKIITGEPAERWSECAADGAREQTCPDIPPHAPARAALSSKAPVLSETDLGAGGPWGLQLAGDRSLARVQSDFNKLQRRFASVLGDRKPLILRSRLGGRGPTTWYRVRVAESTRERATELCARLERAGGSCLVQRN